MIKNALSFSPNQCSAYRRAILKYLSNLPVLDGRILQCPWLVLLIPGCVLAQRIDQFRPPVAAVNGPVAIRTTKAEYTTEARAAGLQGTVALYQEVDADGKPSNIKVLHGLGLGLDEKAVEAARQWQFKPATTDGQPVKLGRSADISFHLDNGGPWRIRAPASPVCVSGTSALQGD